MRVYFIAIATRNIQAAGLSVLCYVKRKWTWYKVIQCNWNVKGWGKLRVILRREGGREEFNSHVYSLASGQFHQHRTRIYATKSITGKSFLTHDHWFIFLQIKQCLFFFPQWIRKIFKPASSASSEPRIPVLRILSRRKTIRGKFWMHSQWETCLGCRETLVHDRKINKIKLSIF